MKFKGEYKKWAKGDIPIAVVLISLNEGHNMEGVLENLKGWAQEVFLVDSYSQDDTVEIALSYGVHVVQRRFRGFGDQWNFAMRELPITAPWTMKLDPDERISNELKDSIGSALHIAHYQAFEVRRYLYFLGKRLPVSHDILRLWCTGYCKFSDVAVNEHPIVHVQAYLLEGALEHHDSPNLHHWFIKQNRYTTSEAEWQYLGKELSVEPRFFGNALQRRMWLKKYFWHFPLRYVLLFSYHYLVLGAWRAGRTGFYWAQLRTFVYRQWEMKSYEMSISGLLYKNIPESPGVPDSRVTQFD